MKTLLVLLVLLLTSPVYAAPFLACDVPAPLPAGVQVEITIGVGSPTVNTGTVTVRGSDLLIYDLTGFATAKYTFRARFVDASGWVGDWSLPFSASKPGVGGGGMRVVQ